MIVILDLSSPQGTKSKITTGERVSRASAAGHRADHQKRLPSLGHRGRQQSIRRLLGQVRLAGEEAHERSSLAGSRVPKRAPQRGVTQLDRVEHGPLGGDRLHLYLPIALRELAQMAWQHDANHDSVCASTESTAGKSRTMGAQLSPESGEAYTWPPVVPK